MAKRLIPPDKKRCQAECLEGSFMTLGPRKYIRCTNVPTIIAKENKPATDGQRGSMSLCDKCAAIMVEKLGASFATLRPIKRGTGWPVKENYEKGTHG